MQLAKMLQPQFHTHTPKHPHQHRQLGLLLPQAVLSEQHPPTQPISHTRVTVRTCHTLSLLQDKDTAQLMYVIVTATSRYPPQASS